MPRVRGDYRIASVVGPWVCVCSEFSFGYFYRDGHGVSCFCFGEGLLESLL